MKLPEKVYLMGIPVCIGIYWVVFQLTSDWFIQCLAGIILFGGLSIVDRYLERKEAEMKKMSPKTFREWAELSLKKYRQRKEREEAEG